MGNQRSNSERLICSGPKESVRGIAFCNEQFNSTESLILAQDERWRDALHMQVVRESLTQVADG